MRNLAYLQAIIVVNYVCSVTIFRIFIILKINRISICLDILINQISNKPYAKLIKVQY